MHAQTDSHFFVLSFYVTLLISTPQFPVWHSHCPITASLLLSAQINIHCVTDQHLLLSFFKLPVHMRQTFSYSSRPLQPCLHPTVYTKLSQRVLLYVLLRERSGTNDRSNLRSPIHSVLLNHWINSFPEWRELMPGKKTIMYRKSQRLTFHTLFLKNTFSSFKRRKD